MWLGITLAVGFGLAVVAICYFAVAEREREGSPLLGEHAVEVEGSGAPLPRASADQVVFEVERHIDAELAAIGGDVDARLAHVFERGSAGRPR